MRYWIGVASRQHVLTAVKGGFAQFGHGKPGPAKRPAKGDWITYYSPKEKLGAPAPCQRFVAIGQFLDAAPRQVTRLPGFKPWRRRVAYRKATEAPIRPLIDRLSFIKNKAHWGATFRFGFLQIAEKDFSLIARRMLSASREIAVWPVGEPSAVLRTFLDFLNANADAIRAKAELALSTIARFKS